MNSKPNKPTIIIDIDDVIAANAAGFIEWSNERFGTNLTIDDYQEHWAEVWKVDLEETKKRAFDFHESGHVATYKVIEGAKEVLEKLKERYRLVIVTSRRLSIEKLTRDWIDRYYSSLFDDIVFAGFFDSPDKSGLGFTKASLAKNLKADFLIDDQLKHIEAAAQVGIKGVLFGEYKWNKKNLLPVGVTRAKNWSEVLEYFSKAK